MGPILGNDDIFRHRHTSAESHRWRGLCIVRPYWMISGIGGAPVEGSATKEMTVMAGRCRGAIALCDSTPRARALW